MKRFLQTLLGGRRACCSAPGMFHLRDMPAVVVVVLPAGDKEAEAAAREAAHCVMRSHGAEVVPKKKAKREKKEKKKEKKQRKKQTK
jgi:hypothetical protein